MPAHHDAHAAEAPTTSTPCGARPDRAALVQHERPARPSLATSAGDKCCANVRNTPLFSKLHQCELYAHNGVKLTLMVHSALPTTRQITGATDYDPRGKALIADSLESLVCARRIRAMLRRPTCSESGAQLRGRPRRRASARVTSPAGKMSSGLDAAPRSPLLMTHVPRASNPQSVSLATRPATSHTKAPALFDS